MSLQSRSQSRYKPGSEKVLLLSLKPKNKINLETQITLKNNRCLK